MSDAAELLRQYVARSQPAFGEVVARYVNLVFTAAVRELNGDRHRAEVWSFALLAKNS